MYNGIPLLSYISKFSFQNISCSFLICFHLFIHPPVYSLNRSNAKAIPTFKGFVMAAVHLMKCCHLKQRGWTLRALYQVQKSEKDKYCMVSLTCVIQKIQKLMNIILKKSRLTWLSVGGSQYRNEGLKSTNYQV